MSKSSLKRKKIALRVVLFILFLNLAWCSGLLHAAELIRLDQSKIRLNIPPGASRAGVINVENPTNQARSIQVYLEDWNYLPSADGTKKFVPANSTALSCASWISFSPAEILLPPFSRGKINYTVRVPEDARGGHYSVLFFENFLGQPETEAGVVNVSLAIRIAVLFYIEPEGTINQSASIENISFKIEQGDLLSLSADFKNNGNIDITAGGTFNIIDSSGMIYARGEFQDIYTFPGEEAELKASSKGRLAAGIYDLVITLDLSKAFEEAGQERKLPLVRELELEVNAQGKAVLR